MSGNSFYAHALAQVEPDFVGIHLFWHGPPSWVYSPGGWSIQRRVYEERERICEYLDRDRISQLNIQHELRLSFGTLTSHQGPWVASLTEQFPPLSPAAAQPLESYMFQLDLDETQSAVHIQVGAEASFVIALREFKVMASSGPVEANASYELRAIDIDTVVIYTHYPPIFLEICLEVLDPEADKEWEATPFIADGLQIPLEELMPSLSGLDAEFTEATSRLIPGESLDPDEFIHLANTLRIGLQHTGQPRPLDRVMLIREDTNADFEEINALDPIRVLQSHPKWRRVLGLGWIDLDPDLTEGETYEYRITGFFPAEDLADRVYGFHTVPTRTMLPAVFFLDDLSMRLSQPVKVELAPGTSDFGNIQISRRGIRLSPHDESFWLYTPFEEDWSLIVDFSTPVSSVILELHEEHDLWYAAGDPGDTNWVNDQEPVPDGITPRLDFPEPVAQLRLGGTGFLFALRVPAGPTGLVPVSVVLPPVTLVNTPRPAPPIFASLHNLQRPFSVAEDNTPPAIVSKRHALGFEIRWRPAPARDVIDWPPDIEAAPPLEAVTFQIEHCQVESSKVWTPILPVENSIMGDRNDLPRNMRIYRGVNLMDLFPEVSHKSASGCLDLYWRDIFDFEEGGEEILRPLPPPGTLHKYRVRAVDVIGRPSETWTETDEVLLEKRVPPPVPVGPQESTVVAPESSMPSGVHARVLARGAPDLTTDEQVILGEDDNVIILHWGWHDQQRLQDPFAREFRIYVASPLDTISGNITNVNTVEVDEAAVYEVTVQLERRVVTNAARGLTLDAGYPFYIRSHTDGDLITVILETRIKTPNGVFHEPISGSVRLPLPLTPNLTHPPAWNERIEVQQITEAESYQAIFRNYLVLTAEHPQDALWVGVSCADNQSYVPDSLAPVENRPGNESAIVPVLCQGRYYGRPQFDITPTLDPVPALLTPEPANRPIYFQLDLTPYLAETGLTATDRIFPERASAAAVYAACYVTEDNRIMGRVLEPRGEGESDLEIEVSNPDDLTALAAALRESSTSALEDRFVGFLAGMHPYRDRLFEPVAQEALLLGPFQETLSHTPGRYTYRVRKADAAGHLSVGGAMAKVIVRVPSLLPGAAPEKAPAESGDAPGMLRLRIASDPELTHLMIFSQVTMSGAGPLGEAEVLRVPNRPDLYPNNGIWLRTADGTLLSPQVKALSDADVTVDADGFHCVTVNFSADPGQRVRVWTCTLTRDGIPSQLGGPWGLSMPAAPLPAPMLAVTVVESDLNFTWIWPLGPKYDVALERSVDDTSWQRVSPLLNETVARYISTQPVGHWRYRLAVMSPEGRIAHSNIVTP